MPIKGAVMVGPNRPLEVWSVDDPDFEPDPSRPGGVEPHHEIHAR